MILGACVVGLRSDGSTIASNTFMSRMLPASGIVYRLWNPQEFKNFGAKFKTATRTLFCCQRKVESPMSLLPDDVIFYILNMCRWDWFGDNYVEMTNRGGNTVEEESKISEVNESAHSARARRWPMSRPTPRWPSLPYGLLSSIFPVGTLESTGDEHFNVDFGSDDDEDSDESWAPH